MNRIAAALCTVLCLSLAAPAQSTSSNAAKVARGKYLVNQAGQCQDCHTPRNEKGEFIKEKWLQGSPLAFQPVVEMPWIGTAPPIAGLDGWTDQQAITFLTTGVRKDGTRPKPPMPEYRFNKEDAAAIASYLRSLKQSSASRDSVNLPKKSSGDK